MTEKNIDGQVQERSGRLSPPHTKVECSSLEGGLLNKSSCSAPALGAIKFTFARVMILATHYCAA
jgi:hypothetical protein